MADHRKSFRPRRLAFDGRLLSRGCLLGATLALLCTALPAEAQDAGLKNGAASLNSGNYNAAVRQLSAAVNDRNSSKGQAAKALYLRGVAYRKLSQPGRAISDLGADLAGSTAIGQGEGAGQQGPGLQGCGALQPRRCRTCSGP